MWAKIYSITHLNNLLTLYYLYIIRFFTLLRDLATGFNTTAWYTWCTVQIHTFYWFLHVQGMISLSMFALLSSRDHPVKHVVCGSTEERLCCQLICINKAWINQSQVDLIELLITFTCVNSHYGKTSSGLIKLMGRHKKNHNELWDFFLGGWEVLGQCRREERGHQVWRGEGDWVSSRLLSPSAGYN